MNQWQVGCACFHCSLGLGKCMNFSNPFTSDLFPNYVQPYTPLCSALGYWQWRRDFWSQGLCFVYLCFCPSPCPPGPGIVCGTLGEWMNEWMTVSRNLCTLKAIIIIFQPPLLSPGKVGSFLLNAPPRLYFPAPWSFSVLLPGLAPR